MLAAGARVDLDELKSRHSLADVVEAAGVGLRGKGRVRQGPCPFHEETEGSFTVYGDTERFHCFGCGATGDVLDFVQRTEGLTLPEAIRRLGGGLELHAASPSRSGRQSQPRPAAVPAVHVPDTALLMAAARFYAIRLKGDAKALEYLASRRIGGRAAAGLGLGYAPGSGLAEALEAAGFDGSRMKASGLFLDGGSERFAGMVVVPEVARGRVAWLTGRAIDSKRSPRFQALPGPKPVLGLGRLGHAPPWLVLTEGVFDWLVLASWGLPACAALGTQGLERVAESLRICPRVFIALDSDDPGRTASARLASLLGRRAATVTLPPGAGDVADLATAPAGRTLFLRSLHAAACSAGRAASR